MAIESVDGQTTEFGRCNSRPTVFFQAAESHHPLTLYCLVNRGTCVNNLPKVVTAIAQGGSQNQQTEVVAKLYRRVSIFDW